MTDTLHVTVAGHTNVGKTSLLRTLGRHATFGKVNDGPGTTQHVESLSLRDGNQDLVVFYDTPGLEDAMALREFIDDLAEQSQLSRWDGPAKVKAFLQSTRAKQDFQQEAKVLNQLLQSDAVLFVLDVRAPVLEKYLDELELLNLCGKPLLPVFNFVASEDSQEDLWRKELHKVGLHYLIAFDSVTPAISGEAQLYQALSSMLPQYQPALNAWLEQVKQQQDSRWQMASQYVAELLINAASYRHVINKEEQQDALTVLQDKVRKAEQKTVEQLLELYEFPKSEILGGKNDEVKGRWQQDLFHSASLQAIGVRTSKGAASGAAIGASIDVATGGLSLGMGTALGAALGAGATTWRHYGSRLQEWWSGKHVLTLDDELLRALILRQYWLIATLSRRGHGAQGPIALPEDAESEWQKAKLPSAIEHARANPDWCAWGKLRKPNQSLRSEKKLALAEKLQQQFQGIELRLDGGQS